MINVEQFLDIAGYYITSSNDLSEESMMPGLRQIDFSIPIFDSEEDNLIVSIVVDTCSKPKNVVFITAFNESFGPYEVYVWHTTHQDYVDYCETFDIGIDEPYLMLTLEEMLDHVSKATLGEPMPTMTTIDVELSDSELLFLFNEAHKQDVTFNDFIVSLISDAVKRAETLLESN